MGTAAAVAPPPGFTLDSDTPAPPEGFELDSTPGRGVPPPLKTDAEIAARNKALNLPGHYGAQADPGSPPGMLTPPNPNAPEPTARTFNPGGAPPVEPPTGQAGISSGPRDKVPAQASGGLKFTPTPIRPLTKPQNPATIPGPNRFYDFYEKYLGHPAEGLSQIYTGIAQLPLQGGRGLYGMVTGEDPMKTEAAQQRIGAATSYGTGPDARHYGLGLPKEGVPGTSGGGAAADVTSKIVGYPTIPAEKAGQYLTDQGHPGYGTAARIALDPYNYIPFMFRGGRPAEPMSGPPRPAGARVDPRIGTEAPVPPAARAEPSVGALPDQPPPEFKPIGEGPPMPAPKRTDPHVSGGKLPEVPSPEFKPIDTTPDKPVMRIVDEKGAPVEQVPAGKPRVTPKQPKEPTVSEVSTNSEGIPEVSVDEGVEPTVEISSSPVEKSSDVPRRPEPAATPEQPKTTFDLLGTYRKQNPGYTPQSYLTVPDSEVRAGGVEGGTARKVNQSVAFDSEYERALVEPARLQRLAQMERQKATGDPARATEYDAQAVQAFEKLQDLTRNMTPEDAAKYGALKDAPLTTLQRASERYYDQVRGQMLRARESRPTASGVQIRARPFEQEHYEPPTEPPVAPEPAAPTPDQPPPPPGAQAERSGSSPPEPPTAARDPRLRESDEQYAQSMRHAESYQSTDPQLAGKMSKGAGMERAARERQITGNLTGKERAAADARLASNYVGKEVTAGGQPGTVQGMSFGRVRVKLPDGTVKSFLPEEVGPPAPPPSGAGGTLSSNPIPSPVSAVRAARELTSAAGDVLAPTKVGKLITDNKLAQKIKQWQTGARTFMNAVQTMPEEAHEPVMMAHDFVREQQANAYKAYEQRRQPGADVEAINKTEQDAYQVAKEKLQQDLLDNGYAQIGGKAQDATGFVPIHARALEFGKGMYLNVRKDVAPAVRQMVQAYDSTAPGEVLARKVEDVWNTPQTFMMWDPAFHIATVAGRMEPYAFKGNSLAGPSHWKFAKETKADPQAYGQLIKDGLQPMKMTYSQRDFGAQAGGVEKAGQGKSLPSRLTGATYDAWQAFHQKMPQAVNTAQLAFFDMMKKDLIAKGMPEDAAHATAIRQANNIAGNIPKEEMGRAWGHILKFGVFSKSYTSTVIRQMTQSIMDDKLLMAQLERKGYGQKEVRDFLENNKDQFTKGLMLDYVNNYAISQALNYWRTGADDAPDKNGKKGPHFTWDNPGAHKSEGIMPQRIYLSNKDGKDLYIETPMRTVRDMYLFLAQSGQILNGEQPDWLRRKSNPTTRTILETAAGADMYGRKFGDAPGAIAHGLAATGPWNELPYAAAEAYREGNMSYLSGYLSSELDMPESTIMKVLGLQPHTEREGSEERMHSGEATKAQEKIWDRAKQAEKNWTAMSPEGQDKTEQAITEDAEKAGMDAPNVLKVLNYIKRQQQSKGSVRQGQRFQEQNKQ